MIYSFAMDVGLLRDRRAYAYPVERPTCSSRSLTQDTLTACSVAPGRASLAVSGVSRGSAGSRS